MKNNILLTGSTGFLGKHIYDELYLTNNVYTLSRSNSTYNCDLINNVPEFNQNFDVVIHTAGIAHYIPKSKSEKKLYYKNNVAITENLLTGLKEVNVKKFVFISSVSVYGLLEGTGINEEQELNAVDPYGRSKIYSENIITKWCKLNNVKLTILRLPLIVGFDPPGNLRSMIEGIKYGYYFNINGGIARKSMVMISDVAKIIIFASEVGGIYNLTDSYHPNLMEISTCISKSYKKKYILNMPLSFAKILATIGDYFGNWFPINNLKLKKLTSNLTFDDSKAVEELDWNPHKVIDCFTLN